MNPFAKLLARFSKPNLSANSENRFQSSFDARQVTNTIDQALASAGLGQTTGVSQNIRATIADALAQAGLGNASASGAARAHFDSESEIVADVVPSNARSASAESVGPVAQGEFLNRSFTNAAGTRTYKLYVPASYNNNSGARVPLIVMLHGCTQSPDDFAAGTRMNALADTHGFLVAYPAQTPKDNGSKCWNWFRSEDQARGRGEPSIIAGIAGIVASEYRIDTHRVFVAGLSAGAAMAVILGKTYPDVFAAVGAHSGLPFGAAHDVPSAFAAMQSGIDPTMRRKAKAEQTPSASMARTVPTIVFHGDADRTVAQRNGAAIVLDASQGATQHAALHKTHHKGVISGGRAFTSRSLLRRCYECSCGILGGAGCGPCVERRQCERFLHGS